MLVAIPDRSSLNHGKLLSVAPLMHTTAAVDPKARRQLFITVCRYQHVELFLTYIHTNCVFFNAFSIFNSKGASKYTLRQLSPDFSRFFRSVNLAHDICVTLTMCGGGDLIIQYLRRCLPFFALM